MSGDEDLWYVKTPDGDVHRVTLDQLDEAFQAGRIDGKVMVLPSGATKWQTLGELAGLDDAPPAATAQPTPRTGPPPTPSSFRPVSLDLSLDENAFKKKSPKRLVIGAIAGVFVLCGGIVMANLAHVGEASGSSAAAAAVTTPPAAPPPPVPDPQPVAAAAAASSAPQLTDDQKQKLAAADKALQDKSKAKKKNRGAITGGSKSAKYKSQGFTSGGNKFDPLNSSL